jgi:hypothetical protein
MRTAVVDGEKTIAEVEDRDLAIVDPRHAALTGRTVFAGGHTNPAPVGMAHDGTLSIS